MTRLNVEILIYDGFDDMDAFGILEPLRLASYSVQYKSLRKQDFVSTASGVKIIPAGTFDLQNTPDVLVLPGGGWESGGARAEVNRGEILEVLRQFHSQGKVLASVCTGSLIIGTAGLLKGRPATTNRSFLDELKALCGKVIHARVVDDGDIITAGAITASLDLGIWLTKRFSGVEKAIEVSYELDFELRGPIWHRTQT